MNLRRTILSNNILRLLLRDGIFMDNYTSTPGNFEPYFEYSDKKKDIDHRFKLYFENKPSAPEYKNEIFNKMNAHAGDEVHKYLSYHHDMYSMKKEFLTFLLNEASSRLRCLKSYPFFFKTSTARRKETLTSCIIWINDMKISESRKVPVEFQNYTQNNISIIISQHFSETIINNISQNDLSEKIFKDLENVILNMEERNTVLQEIREEKFKNEIIKLQDTIQSYKNETNEGLQELSKNLTNNLLQTEFLGQLEEKIIDIHTKTSENQLFKIEEFKSILNQVKIEVDSNNTKGILDIQEFLNNINKKFNSTILKVMDEVELNHLRNSKIIQDDYLNIVENIKKEREVPLITHSHDGAKEFLIVMFIILMNSKNKKNEKHFSGLSNSSIARILKLIVSSYKYDDNAIDSIRKEVEKINTKYNDSAHQKYIKELQQHIDTLIENI